MPEKLTIGLDVGGTKMAFAVVNREGNICDETTIPTLGDKPADMTLDRIAQQLNVYLSQYESIEGVGIGVPGPVDSINGIALNAVNLLWRNVAVRDGLAERLDRQVPIYVENDVNVGAIGEQLFGIAQGASNYVYLSVGTGLGGAVMVNNRIMRGSSFAEMEVGHVSLDPVNGRLCTCGQRGCVEMSISGKGFVANANQHYSEFPDTTIPHDDISTHEIIRCARDGDPLAKFVVDEAARALGVTCSWCTNIFNPSLIVLGGGLILATYDLMEERVTDILRTSTLPQIYDAVTIKLSKLTNAALGASALVWYYQKN